MEETKTQNGLIGFFDILGYQSFLENNDADIATSEVLNIINNIGTIVSSGLIDMMNEPDERDKQVLDSIRWLVFSDTILMAMEWDESNIHEWTVFSIAAIRLCRHMFDFGLPLRGAIKNGKYLVSRSCFAGRVIVEAYRAETNLDLAGCSIDESVIDKVKHIATNADAKILQDIEKIAVRYMTPFTNDQYQKVHLLNYLMTDGILPKPDAADIPQMVLNSFWAHHKDITASAERKCRNTENFLRFLFHLFPGSFSNASR